MSNATNEILIGGTPYIVYGIEQKVIRPTVNPDYDPADQIEDNGTFSVEQKEALYAKLADAHGWFLNSLGTYANRVRTLTARGYGKPKNNDARGYRYIPLEWMDFTTFNCDVWDMKLIEKAGGETNYRLRITFLTPEGLLSANQDTHYEGLAYRNFSINETLGLLTYGATGAAIDADGNTDRPEYAIIVSVALVNVPNVSSAKRAPAQEDKRDGWAAETLTEIDWGKSLRYKGKTYEFGGKGRWSIIKILCDSTDPEGWVTIPGGSRSFGCFSDYARNAKGGTDKKGDALRFKNAAIEPKYQGNMNTEHLFRIRP